MDAEETVGQAAVLSRIKVMAAYHSVQRSMEYAANRPLRARRHNAAYNWLKRAESVEKNNPDPKEPCACIQCAALREARR